jgi:hypothetical protein
MRATVAIALVVTTSTFRDIICTELNGRSVVVIGQRPVMKSNGFFPSYFREILRVAADSAHKGNGSTGGNLAGVSLS